MKPLHYIQIPITDEILAFAREKAPLMDAENQGRNTLDGGKDKNVKGIVGQWAVRQYLIQQKWNHTYSEPYVPEQYGDPFDIIVAKTDVWDVKCRGWFEGIKEYRTILMTKKEEADKDKKECDYYMFTTVDYKYRNCYILGGIRSYLLWDKIKKVDPKRKMPIPTAGYLHTKHLAPIYKVILHTD